MLSCCAPQSAYQPQINGLPIRSGDKALWYGLIAFYAVGAVYVLGILIGALR